MELTINYDYSELVSYYQGVIYDQGIPLDFTIIKTTNLATKDLIDLEVAFTKKVSNYTQLRDKIISQFNNMNFK
jgi:hypothetical protein